MNYTSRSKERRSKLFLMKILHILQFQWLYLPISAKIILVWNTIILISLFQTWVIDSAEKINWNSFSSISWNIWYIFILWILTIFFVILSTNKQQKMKHYANISFKNHSLIWAIGIFTIFSIAISISFIHGFANIYQNISYWNGSIFALTGWIVVTVWAYIMRIENKKLNIDTFISQNWEIKEKISSKNNMTLPF